MHISRDPHSDEIIARGGDEEAESILQRAGFIVVARAHDRYHRLPYGLDEDERLRLPRRAVALLKAAGYAVQHDPVFASHQMAFHDLMLGGQVANLAQRIRAAEHSEDASAVLTELVAPGDGVLPAAVEVLEAAAEFVGGLGEDADPHHAARIRGLAEKIAVVSIEISAYRNALADRHTAHPLRPACTGVESTEREASVVCSCPPPPPPAPGVRRGR
ncbi:hypothetical protein ACLF6K_35840 [Streptomyces xanthophaeus]|uniref:hypothetical protein n=1 Tax=Streptomyces xanthophaeus TaxID=67385 RepID=UPI00399007EF